MTIRRLMTTRFCLGIGAALAFASVLGAQSSGPTPNAGEQGVVYVYFSSMCAAPGDARDCRELPLQVRPSFESMAACGAHASGVLEREHEPRLLASCMKVREG